MLWREGEVEDEDRFQFIMKHIFNDILIISLLIMTNCTSSIPVTRGPVNLNKREFAIGGFSNLGINNYDLSGATSGFLDFRGGVSFYTGLDFEYGIFDFLNTSISAWYGVNDWGLLNRYYVQLIKNAHPFTINFGYALLRSNEDNEEYLQVSYIPFIEPLIGFPNNLFVGLRFERRFGNEIWVQRAYNALEHELVYLIPHKRNDNIFSAIFGYDNRNDSRRYTPHVIISYDTETNFWQVSIGICAHYIHIPK
jgi:hypothetical protein